MTMTGPELQERLMQADAFGVKLEATSGDRKWEFFPSPLHQDALLDLYMKVRPTLGEGSCGCFRLVDAYIQFPDGSLKRPDLAIFCERPPLTRQALQVVPPAVVEVLSPDGERKDLVENPPFYLSQGVLDVVVTDPETRRWWHFDAAGRTEGVGPATLDLACGCSLDV